MLNDLFGMAKLRYLNLLRLRGLKPRKRLRSDERGNVALIVAAAFPLIIGAAGLAVDGTEWMVQKRAVQAAADSAAMAGVYGLIAGQGMEDSVSRSVFQNGTVPKNASIQTLQGPPGREDDPFAVQVQIDTAAHMTFSSMFLSKRPVISAKATATVVKNGEFCAFTLDSANDEAGIVLRPNTDVETKCGMTTNSAARQAVAWEGSSTLKALALRAYGSFADITGIKKSGMRPNALKQDDPLDGTEPPPVPNTGCPNLTVNPGGEEVAFEPGCYSNITLNGNVRLRDGEYILNQGNFIVGPRAHVVCNACTIFLTSETAETDPGSIGKVKMSSEATVKLSPMREGPNSGVLFYQNRNAARDLAGDENRIGGNSFSNLEGLMYFPSQTIYVDGNMSPDLSCTRFIARRLVFAGRVYIGKSCDGLDKVTFAATEVRLVS